VVTVTGQQESSYDVVVVGGGAAGLAGALALARARRSVLVVDAGHGRNAPAEQVHNYLGREGTPPGELLAIGRAEVSGYGGQILTGDVTGAERLDGPDGGFRVHVADGSAVLARRLLVTTGLVDELPDVPGWLSGGAGRCCTARTATAGRCATRPSGCSRPARWECTRR